jgi:hypothetical protein
MIQDLDFSDTLEMIPVRVESTVVAPLELVPLDFFYQRLDFIVIEFF